MVLFGSELWPKHLVQVVQSYIWAKMKDSILAGWIVSLYCFMFQRQYRYSESECFSGQKLPTGLKSSISAGTCACFRCVFVVNTKTTKGILL